MFRKWKMKRKKKAARKRADYMWRLSCIDPIPLNTLNCMSLKEIKKEYKKRR